MSDSSSPEGKRRVQAVQSWLKTWSKDCTDDVAGTIADASEQGSDAVLKILENIGIRIKQGKLKKFATQDFPKLTKALDAISLTIQKQISILVPAERGEHEDLLSALHLEEIEQTMVKMTGINPLKEQRIPIRLFSDPRNSANERAHVDFGWDSEPRAFPGFQRIRYCPKNYKGPTELAINTSCSEKDIEEMRGTLFHEYGHIWTQKLFIPSAGGTEAYREGFAELFRSLAAARENASWEFACGSSGFQVLHGPSDPQIIPAHEGKVPGHLSSMSKYLVSNRVIEHLRGLDERKAAGIARACSFASLPSPAVPLEDTLKSIERETGVQGFAEAFLNDPVLKFGNIQKDITTAIAFPNFSGDSVCVYSSTVTDPAGSYLFTRYNYDPTNIQTPPLDNQSFYLDSVQCDATFFRLSAVHQNHPDYRLEMEARGGASITSRQIIEQALAQGIDWPKGPIAFTFLLPGHKPVHLQHKIVITEQRKQKILREVRGTHLL